MSRRIAWWSAGAASAVATAIELGRHGHDRLHIVYCDTRSEHPDNERFRADCERWYNHEIEVLASDEYHDIWDVWERTGWLVGAGGARCTVELKKKLRQRYEDPDDIQVFGYTVEELKRVKRFEQANPDVRLSTPLIDEGLTKSDCFRILDRAGIELPAMYRLGFPNANCIGCPHGSMGYWNRIREVFPDTFWRMAELERKLDNAICRPGGKPVWLDELEPGRGRLSVELDGECGVLCTAISDEIA